MRDSPEDLRRAAIVGAALHAPGLALLLGYRIGPRTRRRNAAALALTAGGVLAAWAGGGGWPVAATFFAGHLGWSSYLAWSVLKGTARR
ncbi:MAG: hypothetical protein ACK4N5_14620 [Myxococcales bacterium]